VDGEPCRAVFGGGPVGEMIEVLSRRASLCETWRYCGAMVAVVGETKEERGSESDKETTQSSKNRWPCPAVYLALVHTPGQTQLTVMGFGEIRQQGPAGWRNIQMLSVGFQLRDSDVSGRMNSSPTRRE
jgi:hypothetical protein